MARKSTRAFAIAFAAASALALAACSDGAIDASPGQSDAAVQLSDSAQAALESAFEGVGGDLSDVPTVSPEGGVQMGIVSCGETISTCALTAQGAKEAAEAAGWVGTIYDGRVTQVDTAIRQAIAAGVDVLNVVGTNCSVYPSAFQEAKDAGIIVVSGGGFDDCDPQLWDAERDWLADRSLADQYTVMGELEADYAYGVTNGDPKVVALEIAGAPFGAEITDAAIARFSQLGAGEVVERVPMSNAEVADGSFVQKAISTLLANPDANVLFATNDAWIINGLGQAIVQSGLSEQLTVIGLNFTGDPTSFDLLRGDDQGMDATIAYAGQWGQWGTVDTAIRLLAGQDTIDIAEPIQIVDRERNLPEPGQAFDGGVDYRAVFSEAWGVN